MGRLVLALVAPAQVRYTEERPETVGSGG